MVVLKVLREFAGGTSIHGFGFLVHPKSSSIDKIIWFILLAVAIAWASFQMNLSVISKYYLLSISSIIFLRPIIIITYHTRAIITRGLYIFYPHFEVQKTFFSRGFFLKILALWLVFKSGF